MDLKYYPNCLQIREQESSDIHGGDELLSIFIPLMRIT